MVKEEILKPSYDLYNGLDEGGRLCFVFSEYNF